MIAVQPAAGKEHAQRMDRMYRYQRHIYDLTRKYYLFGRDTLIRDLDVPKGGSVLEVGCGTGRNLSLVGKCFPDARLFGFDISAEMLATADTRLNGKGKTGTMLRVADATDFSPALFGQPGFDRIVISYALSMIPDWEKAIDSAIAALHPGGSLHIADFGQQEGWPAGFHRALQGWLRRFDVSPRASLFDLMRAKSQANGAEIELCSVGRGYAWIAVYRRAPLN